VAASHAIRRFKAVLPRCLRVRMEALAERSQRLIIEIQCIIDA